MGDFTQAVSLFTSTDGTIFNPLTGIERCKNCGKVTLVCPHKLFPKEKVIQLPKGSTHVKAIRVEPDMRVTMSTGRNSRLTSITDNMKFSLLECMTLLEDLWEEIGINEDRKEKRNATVLGYIQALLKEMCAEEEQLKSKMQLKAEEYRCELQQLCIDLSLPPKQIPANLSLLQLEEKLRIEVDTLNKEKYDRLKSLKRIQSDEKHLCERLAMPCHEIAIDGCPSLDQLREIEQNVKFLKAEKAKRLELFRKLSASIKQLWTDLDSEPITDLQHKICVNDAEETFILSTKNLDAMTDLQNTLEDEHSALLQQLEMLKSKVRSLWDRLEISKTERQEFSSIFESNTPKAAKKLKVEITRLEELKRLHMQKFVESIRKELVCLWDKCYFGEDQRELFRPFYSDVFTEKTLTEHEHQVATLKNYYSENKELFKLVDKREGLWKKKLEFENRSDDFKRLNNRGGALLKEEKIRKAVEKELPKVEVDLRKKVERWEEENESCFLFNGSRLFEHIELQKSHFEDVRNQKKEEKMRAKQMEFNQELQFGSKSTKRKLVVTPAKSKVAKMDQTPSTSRYVHSSIYASPRLPPSRDNKSAPAINRKIQKAIKMQKDTRRKSLKRRSIRLASAKRILSETNGQTNELVRGKERSGSLLDKENISLLSYHDFSNDVAKHPFTRSSFLANPSTAEKASSSNFNFTDISSMSSKMTLRDDKSTMSTPRKF